MKPLRSKSHLLQTDRSLDIHSEGQLSQTGPPDIVEGPYVPPFLPMVGTHTNTVARQSIVLTLM